MWFLWPSTIISLFLSLSLSFSLFPFLPPLLLSRQFVCFMFELHLLSSLVKVCVFLLRWFCWVIIHFVHFGHYCRLGCSPQRQTKLLVLLSSKLAGVRHLVSLFVYHSDLLKSFQCRLANVDFRVFYVWLVVRLLFFLLVSAFFNSPT